jgi:hypothetical protein
MKIAATLILAIFGLSIFLLLTAPYGSQALKHFKFFPLSVFLVLAIGHWPKENPVHRKILAAFCVVGWFCAYILVVTVTHRNERFTMELHGVVSDIYRGGHNAPAIRVTSDSATNVPVADLAEAEWELIQLGETFTKPSGTFEAKCANRILHLENTRRLDLYRRK